MPVEDCKFFASGTSHSRAVLSITCGDNLWPSGENCAHRNIILMPAQDGEFLPAGSIPHPALCYPQLAGDNP